QSLEEHQVAHSIVALEHVSQRSALDRAERQAELHITLVGAAVMMIALVLGTASFAAVHHARHRTRVFLLTSTGQHYAKIHGKFIVLTGLLALLPALIGLLQNQVGPIYNTLIITSCVVVVVATTALTLKLLDASVTRSALEIS